MLPIGRTSRAFGDVVNVSRLRLAYAESNALLRDRCTHEILEEGKYSTHRCFSSSQKIASSQTDGNDAAGVESAKTREIPVRAKRDFVERRVPDGPFERAFAFGSLAANMAVGAAGQMAKRSIMGPSDNDGGSLLSERAANKLAAELCRLRGAGLKIGQMLSIQDNKMLPKVVSTALARARDNADVMPRAQLHRVLEEDWGGGWRSRVRHFDETPFAAASIGQVHRATTLCGRDVAVKVQFPGVARSIDSDLGNLGRLLRMSNVVPTGLFLDRVLDFAKKELKEECDYQLEARNQIRFRRQFEGMPGVAVPEVVEELSTSRVLTTTFAKGDHIDRTTHLPQDVRNTIARRLLQLTLQELFQHRFMQTDPNWANFLYDDEADVLTLIDFGAAREYPKEFIDKYLQLVLAAAARDTPHLLEVSIDLGMLTGDESARMTAAHVAAGLAIGDPFVSHHAFNFKGSDITAKVKRESGTITAERLVPPPVEVYSLHRRLAGAFSTCIQLEACIPCKDLLDAVRDNYRH